MRFAIVGVLGFLVVACLGFIYEARLSGKRADYFQAEAQRLRASATVEESRLAHRLLEMNDELSACELKTQALFQGMCTPGFDRCRTEWSSLGADPERVEGIAPAECAMPGDVVWVNPTPGPRPGVWEFVCARPPGFPQEPLPAQH